jgi:hypothetical protein
MKTENSCFAWTSAEKTGILHASSTFTSNAAVAQWIEYWPPKPRVAGSIPASRTRKFLKIKWLPFFCGCFHQRKQQLYMPHCARHLCRSIRGEVVAALILTSRIREYSCSRGSEYASDSFNDAREACKRWFQLGSSGIQYDMGVLRGPYCSCWKIGCG